MHNVLTLTTQIQRAENNNSSLFIVFIDFHEAFDTISCDFLGDKQYSLGICGAVLADTWALCTSTTARIRTIYGLT